MFNVQSLYGVGYWSKKKRNNVQNIGCFGHGTVGKSGNVQDFKEKWEKHVFFGHMSNQGHSNVQTMLHFGHSFKKRFVNIQKV